MRFQPTREQQEACAQAAELLSGQADGLRRTGSVTTVRGLTNFADTLRKIAAASELNLTVKDKVDVEQATFVLEGQRDGLLTAEFKDRAKKIQSLIRTLNDIVDRYNASTSD